jgi:hypothetical protein
MMRGEYFSKFIQPYHSVNDFTSPPVRNAVISVQDLVEQHADRDARTGAFYYPNEFAPGKASAIALRSMKAFLNLGYGALAATAVRLDERGFLRDAHDNVLIGDAAPEEIAIIQRTSGAGAAYRLRYLPPDTIRFRRGLVYWVFREQELKPL